MKTANRVYPLGTIQVDSNYEVTACLTDNCDILIVEPSGSFIFKENSHCIGNSLQSQMELLFTEQYDQEIIEDNLVRYRVRKIVRKLLKELSWFLENRYGITTGKAIPMKQHGFDPYLRLNILTIAERLFGRKMKLFGGSD